ncbi:hypothetical protein C8R45DRAFT_191280 [Mycena sanguinolenta]|nr:hypothetical protein C8R45DRAFT_191280 [Mycena sanguinolenta]
MAIHGSVLDVQELCDLTVGFLTQYKSDLKACSFVSPTFRSAAQRHLFSDIIVNRGSLDIDDLSFLGWFDEVGACKRLCAVLESSPHLLVFIQRMRTSLEPGVLQLLTKFSFPNLHDIVFHGRINGPASGEAILLASKLISSLSVRRVGLLSLIFNDVQDLHRLLEQRAPALDSIFLDKLIVQNEKPAAEEGNRAPARSFLVHVKALRWVSHNRLQPAVILDPAFPLDLSKLEDVDLGSDLVSPIALKCIEWSRLSIRRLVLDARTLVFSRPASRAEHPPLSENVAVDNYPTPLDRGTQFLARFPALTHLTLVSLPTNLAEVEALLANLPPDNNLRYLNLEFRGVRKLKENKFRAVGAACANLHESCVVTVWIRRFASGADNSDVERFVQTAFAESDDRGRLLIRV